MVLCDTNIFISAFNGRQDTIDQLDKIGLDEIVLSAVTVMELFQGMGTPHLDGNYTIFGRVKSGMDVVDQLLPGDVMERVTVNY